MKKLRRWLIIILGIAGLAGIFLFSRQSSLDRSLISPQVEAEKSIKFALFSDIHSDWQNLDKAISRLRQEKDVRFLIVLGDLSTVGKKEELQQAREKLESLKLPYYVIPGNHDVWLSRKIGENIYGEAFGQSFQTFSFDRLKFILVDNADDEKGISGIAVDSKNQLSWLKLESKECLAKECLVFLHEPLNHPNSYHIMGENNATVASEAGTLKALLKENSAGNLFAGHIHWSSWYDLDGLQTTIVGAISGDRNPQTPRFMVVTCFLQASSHCRFERKEVILGEN